MSDNRREKIEKIRSAISKLISDFRTYPGKYLTESDVRCCLFYELMKHKIFNNIQKSRDDLNTTPLHTEVRWYGKTGKLKYRSVIVIIEPSRLNVRGNGLKMASKGYFFDIPLAIIEIKFKRINGKSNKTFEKEIQNEIERIQKIQTEMHEVCFCALVILDRKNMSKKFERVYDIELFYTGTT